VLNRFTAFVYTVFIVLGLCGCALTSGIITQPQKEPKLICNGSYVQSMVMVRAALRQEPIQFEKGIIAKDTATLKGSYADGKTIQIVISKVTNITSSLVVHVVGGSADKEDSQKIFSAILQYSNKQKKQ
jgi:hypothetical protein